MIFEDLEMLGDTENSSLNVSVLSICFYFSDKTGAPTPCSSTSSSNPHVGQCHHKHTRYPTSGPTGFHLYGVPDPWKRGSIFRQCSINFIRASTATAAAGCPESNPVLSDSLSAATTTWPSDGDWENAFRSETLQISSLKKLRFLLYPGFALVCRWLSNEWRLLSVATSTCKSDCGGKLNVLWKIRFNFPKTEVSGGGGGIMS